MNRLILTLFTTSTLFSGAASAQDPGFMHKLDAQKHRELMPVHTRMTEMQTKQDADLAPLLEAMHSATGEKRVDALVAVVNMLVEQRKAMHEQMAKYLDR
jgi:hypothetical protein